MSQSDFLLVGLILSFLLTFILSFLNVIFTTYSRIGFSRILEENSPLKEEILEHYDELKIAIDYGRIAFLLAFVIYTSLVFPGLAGWPFWGFLLFLALYLLLFDYLPRLFLLALGEKHLRFFLPVLFPVKFILAPLLLLPRIFLRREEERQAAWRTHETTEEEIETFIDEATEEGIIEKDQNELLRGVVEFGDQMVREIMTPRSRVVAVDIETTVGQLKEVFVREKYSRIPVYRERLDNIQGMVMAKDLLEFSDQEQAGRKIDFLVRPVMFVPETMAVNRLLKEFKKVKQKLAIVVDEYGGVSGLVTMEDLLEEIVGEIQDEYDTEEPQIVAEKPDTYLVQGETEVEDLEELLGSELSDENLLTINGLLQQHLGRLPRPGEKLELAGLGFEILEVDDKSIRKVRVTRKRADNQTEKGE
ncbi:MAG: Magnesium and cobalt efflux protein CorC [Candidatus Saccharicenans subterraneus]|uniref:Magnesium and cobalt efflux protein CorC n=1 Tax=Candidatus Saccharicenans subterraneus TaxID=2508984 RepID=A0A3E2BLE5_9BACT|nr:MAG: Magnesium and cobalt efflux protein CorC [Candidatus Saccharicenans subterraneum]